MTEATLSPTAQATLDNPVLYTQSLLKIRSKVGEVIPFKLNRVQRRLCRIKQKTMDQGKPLKFLILKGRREGITTFEQAMNFHKVATQHNQQVVTLAHETESAEKIFRIANLFYEQLPEVIRPKRLAAHNKRNFNFPSFNSFYDIGTAGGKAFGRGDTLNRVHWSEVAWSCNSKDDQRTLLSGLTEACSHGEIVLETTPNGTGDLFHEKSVEARKGENDWTFIFFTWWDDPTYFIKLTASESADLVSSYTKDETALVAKHKLRPEQMAWRRAQIRELGHLFWQEYPEDVDTCFILSGSCFFDKEILETILLACPNPIETKDNGEYLVWENPLPGATYVAASDLGEGREPLCLWRAQREDWSSGCGLPRQPHAGGLRADIRDAGPALQQRAARVRAEQPRALGPEHGIQPAGVQVPLLAPRLRRRTAEPRLADHAEDAADHAGRPEAGRAEAVHGDQGPAVHSGVPRVRPERPREVRGAGRQDRGRLGHRLGHRLAAVPAERADVDAHRGHVHGAHVP